jgi:SAM-dependent methyltransferase
MTLPLRHQGRALLVGDVETMDGDRIVCRSRGTGPWRWAEMLEGAAQSAGILAGSRPGGLPRRAVVAEYRDVAVRTDTYSGPLRFEATLERRLLRFWRCRIAVLSEDGKVLVDGRVTLAPAVEPSRADADAPATAGPPSDPDPRLYAVLADAGLPDGLFNPRQHRSCELVERYALALAIDVARRLDLPARLARPASADELVATAGFVPAFRHAARWVLDRLAVAGFVARDGVRYRLEAALPVPDLVALRTEILASDPTYAPAIALLDEAASLYPAVARGEISGEQALFRRAALWFAYFSNDNGYYALANRVAAHAAAARVTPGAAVLEVGAGPGSATEALLERLDELGLTGDVCGYRVTEPVPLFRRRAERTLGGRRAAPPLEFASLDVNESWRDQGIPPRTFDLVWGVNVFHLARDLDATLRQARDAIAPGGWLVVGEGVRPSRGHPVGAELPFLLLESFVNVALDPATRATPGFLSADEWLAAFTRAGFPGAELVPDAIRVRALYPGFLAVAVCAQVR